jgi:response regulator RpfG family c-di-GMP phosphodiesterase
LILMDIQMPDMDGITATQLIRAHYAPEKQPKIIALTAEALTEGVEKYLKVGMNGVLNKPVQIDELVSALSGISREALLQSHAEDLSQNKASSLSEFPTLDTSVIDDFMKLMSEEGKESAIHLIDLYKNGTPDLIGKIEGAFAQRNLKELLKLIHTLKGSSSQIGALRMVEFCSRLEVLLKQSGIEPFATFIPGLKEEFSTLDQGLNEFITNLD